ncbi:MAG TPA: hypothetical protein VNQ76_11310 [Planctomicrobium sp.]|nr:hypothetical protein [Planctomicrobium sp.]
MSAHVRDLQSIRDFRAKLIGFAEEVESVLQSLQTESQRAFEWVEHDRPQYWAIQQRKAFDLLAATRTALTTCQMRTVGGRRSSCIEEKVAFDKAKRRLQQTQEQQEKVKRWTVKIHHDVDEFRGRMSALRRLLDVDIPKAIALLDRSAEILESYAEVAPPKNDAT